MRMSEELPMVKSRTRCNDCGFTFHLEDAQPCIHRQTMGIGTTECPQCHSCICHGQTADQIKARFQRNISIGKFVKSRSPMFDWHCKTIKTEEIQK